MEPAVEPGVHVFWVHGPDMRSAQLASPRGRELLAKRNTRGLVHFAA